MKDSSSNVRGSKQSVYEGGVRVPLIIAGPGVTRVGEREDALVVSSDLFATILSLAGVPATQVHDSYSLVPLLTDDSAETGREFAFTELRFSNNNGRYAIRNEQYKLMYESNTWQMYDLHNDLAETNNLYNDPSLANVRNELHDQLDAIEAGGAAGCFQNRPSD